MCFFFLHCTYIWVDITATSKLLALIRSWCAVIYDGRIEMVFAVYTPVLGSGWWWVVPLCMNIAFCVHRTDSFAIINRLLLLMQSTDIYWYWKITAQWPVARISPWMLQSLTMMGYVLMEISWFLNMKMMRFHIINSK